MRGFDQALRRRIGALAILALLLAAVWLGPVGAYWNLCRSGADELDSKQALLQRYRALMQAITAAPSPQETVLLLPAIADSQAVALLQETIKTAAASAGVQIQGLQVLRAEALPGAARVGVRVRAAGDIAGLGRLLYAIEAARPLLVADNLQVQSRTVGPKAPSEPLEFQFDVSGFKPGAAS